jgi:hypothetical protein
VQILTVYRIVGGLRIVFVRALAAAEQGPGWEVYEGVVVRLADSGRIGVVRRIAADGACFVALGQEDADKRVQLPADPELLETVRP